jgi:hypothetical protein
LMHRHGVGFLPASLATESIFEHVIERTKCRQ